ncbi:UNVERIFIED_CONTAM: hypothetical protein Slati_3511000 [Sesamum latifolium]|uniref:Uncharacterized protein n=1 Tax=Sesamum latifolium TaxID=2727402 RepID=A0AAW2ULB0_9LAMI
MRSNGDLSQDCQLGNLNAINEDASNFVCHGGKSNFNPYSNTYNPGWRSHPNFSWSNNQHQGPPGYHQPRQQPPQEKKSNLKDMLSNFITTANTRFQNLEMQVGQLVNIVCGKKEGQLPSDTEKNSREQANAITARSERTVGEESLKEQAKESQVQKEQEP